MKPAPKPCKIYKIPPPNLDQGKITGPSHKNMEKRRNCMIKQKDTSPSLPPSPCGFIIVLMVMNLMAYGSMRFAGIWFKYISKYSSSILLTLRLCLICFISIVTIIIDTQFICIVKPPYDPSSPSLGWSGAFGRLVG